MCEINREDYLFILKQDNIESHEEILNDLWLDDDGIVYLHWSSDCDFSNSEVKVVNDFRKKLCFLFSALHEDTMIINLAKKLVPEIIEIKLPAERFVKGFNMQEWQKKYNFTLEEFLTNKKYVVVSDHWSSVERIMELGLFNWDNIEASSVLDD